MKLPKPLGFYWIWETPLPICVLPSFLGMYDVASLSFLTSHQIMIRAGQELQRSLNHFEQLASELHQKKLANPTRDSMEQTNNTAVLSENRSEETNPFADDTDDQRTTQDNAKNQTKEPQVVVKFVKEVDESFLNLFLRFTDAYQSLFIQRPNTSSDDRVASLGLLEEFAGVLFRRYLALIRCHLFV